MRGKMKEVLIVSDNKNYKAGDIGLFDELSNYSFSHPQLKMVIPGKVFLGEKLETSGVEVSFQIMSSKMKIPFLHSHRENEELYIFLKGEGEFQVDGNFFRVKEGSVIKVSPEGKRSWRNTSEKPLILMVIQTRQGSLNNFNVSDGFPVADRITWE
jgi:mannose-6-phosphate isomerase-like protein (cupin superfamily)